MRQHGHRLQQLRRVRGHVRGGRSVRGRRVYDEPQPGVRGSDVRDIHHLQCGQHVRRNRGVRFDRRGRGPVHRWFHPLRGVGDVHGEHRLHERRDLYRQFLLRCGGVRPDR